jgi:hypothetical protein
VRQASIAVANLRCDARSSWCGRENAIFGEQISGTSIAGLAGEVVEKLITSGGSFQLTLRFSVTRGSRVSGCLEKDLPFAKVF